MCRNLAFSLKFRNFLFPSQYISPNVGILSKHNKRDFKCFSSSNYNLSAQAVDLSYSLFEPETQLSSPVPVIILHGALGSKQNWRGIGKAIATKSKRKVYALDARNHGDSPHAEDYNYPLMSEDVKRFIHSQAIQESVIVGHSMGGRTAMYLALTDENLVNKLVVVDVSPTKMPHQSSLIPGYMRSMQKAITSIPKQSLVQARKSVDEYLSKTIPEIGIRQFLITNLGEENNLLKWKPNLDVLIRKFESGLLEFPSVSGHYSKETIFICGGDSPFVKPEDYPDIKKSFPKAEFIRIAGAGHWVHSEKPYDFLNVLYDFL